MKLKRAVITVCTWTFSVVLAAAAQSVAAERPPQTSPDTTVLEKGIKEKLESANLDARRPSPSKASPSRSYLKLEPVRSFRHGARLQPKSPSKLQALSSRSHIKSKSARSFGHRAHHASKSPSNSKALPSGSHSRTHQRYRSHRHRSSRAGEQPGSADCNRSYTGSGDAPYNRSYCTRLVETQRNRVKLGSRYED
jgi:hypothetical protein